MWLKTSMENYYLRTSLFLTHLHSDHIGLVQDFVDRSFRVYMHEADHEYFGHIKAGDVWPYMEALFRREGFPAEELSRQATENLGRRYAPEHTFPATLVKDCSRLRLGNTELVCIHTPGHTPGHTALYLPEAQVLFSGDHILFDITPNISMKSSADAPPAVSIAVPSRPSALFCSTPQRPDQSLTVRHGSLFAGDTNHLMPLYRKSTALALS